MSKKRPIKRQSGDPRSFHLASLNTPSNLQKRVERDVSWALNAAEPIAEKVLPFFDKHVDFALVQTNIAKMMLLQLSKMNMLSELRSEEPKLDSQISAKEQPYFQ